jgi:hypothetical protein
MEIPEAQQKKINTYLNIIDEATNAPFRVLCFNSGDKTSSLKQQIHPNEPE